MNIVRRREIKYLLNTEDYKKVKNHIRKVLTSDIHNKDGGYTIRSLYFDTIDDRDFQEKEAGVEIRRKVRLRVYDPEATFAMLEMKQKEGDYQLKRSLVISREDAILLSKGNYSCLLDYEDPFAMEMYLFMTMNLYRPKVIVEYRRDAFVVKENSIRLTFDHDIVATEASMNIFDPNLQMNPIIDKNNYVLEVKYNGFLLSYVKDLIESVSCINTSVSKYYMSRNVTHKIIV